MRHSFGSTRHALVSRLVIAVMIYSLVALPLSAARPPAGYARPPIHIKPTAGTSPSGYQPSQVLHAYGFDQIANQGAGQTIAIIDAYDDPNIQSDLNKFDSTFHLSACDNTAATNFCFTQLYASGSRPSTNAGWALEISLDVEWAHAIAPQAKILLVEAASNSFTNLFSAIDVAVQSGANVVSMSWGGSEFSSESNYDSHFAVSNVTFTASSGDSGNGVEYPAASPNVISVGGTTLKLTSGNAWSSETAWSGSGGGLSVYENEPPYQSTFGIPNDPNGVRGVPDISYDGNPNTGFAVYDSIRYQGQKGWFQVGGTSAGAPQWAALFAIANSLRGSKGPLGSNALNAVYNLATGSTNYAGNYHDIKSGNNGNCGVICNAATGYDYVTGIGSPQANQLLPALQNY